MTGTPPNVDTRTEWARRKPIYQDVEELISTGYITCPVEINGVDFALRSMVLGDHRVISSRVGMKVRNRVWKEWAVASTVWMVDGTILLGQPNAAVNIRRALREIPEPALDALFSVFTGLYNRLSEAISRVEAFCYEDYSRVMWRMSNSGRREISEMAGVPSPGTNPVLRAWVAFNVAEDIRDEWQREWVSARFIASAHNPKGVKRIAQRDEMDRKMEEERRQRIVDSLFYRVTGQHVGEIDGHVLKRAVTREELIDEMNRWVRGDKDWHDQMIDSYKEAIRAAQESERQRHSERMLEMEELNGEVGVVGGVRSAGLTREQLRDFVGGASLDKTTVNIGDVSDRRRLFDKYLASEIKVGSLGLNGYAEKLEGYGESSLDDEITARRVVVRTDDDRSE